MQIFSKILSVAAFLIFAPRISLLKAEDLLSCKGHKPLSTQESAQAQDRLQKSYALVTSLSAEFLQESFLQALDISETSSGKVQFLRPGKMRWDYLEPEEQLFLFSDQTMWFYQKGQNQVLIDAATDVLLSDLPISFLLGIGDIKRDFDLTVACKRAEGIVLDLLPKKAQSGTEEAGNKQQGLKGFQLLVEPERHLPIGARIVDVGGNVTTVLLRGVEINQLIEPTVFATDFPRGVDIQDRRKEHGSEL